MTKHRLTKVPIAERLVQVGDMFLTRNFKEEDNSSPGHWNHVAMYVGGGYVVEAQEKPNAVIKVAFEDFWCRYPEILVLRYKKVTPEIQKKLASSATKYIGVPYRRIASIFVFLRKSSRGENCTSLFRRVCRDVYGGDPKWGIPDSVLSSGLFNLVVAKDERNFWETG
jgi:uncharacterized protein YycO